jgi:predicted ferric reductase
LTGAAGAAILPRVNAARARLAGWVLGVLAAANGAVVVWLWLRSGGITDIEDGATLLSAAGRIAGLLGAYLALLELLLLARLPALERLLGFDRLTTWHRWCGTVCLALLAAHAIFITSGYTLGDGISLTAEIGRLISGYPGVITAVAGLVMLAAVGLSSAPALRRRLRYETWYFIHLYAYLAIALAFSHQLATGTAFVGRPGARAYWIALYVATLGVLVVYRLSVPVARSLRHRLRVARVVEEAPGVTSIEIEGVGLDRLAARAGQFFTWRFLTRDRWWEAHPFSLSAAPDGRRLRITVKGLGDYTAALRAIPPGTRVIAEGPFGAFTVAARRRPRVVLIAGGVGITPIRALLEEMPGAPGDITVVYRATRPEDLILRTELDELAGRRGAEVHYVLGDDRDRVLLSPEHLQQLVPDIAARDVYVCGPPDMTEATRVSLGRSGVSRRHIVTERFAY